MLVEHQLGEAEAGQGQHRHHDEDQQQNHAAATDMPHPKSDGANETISAGTEGAYQRNRAFAKWPVRKGASRKSAKKKEMEEKKMKEQ